MADQCLPDRARDPDDGHVSFYTAKWFHSKDRVAEAASLFLFIRHTRGIHAAGMGRIHAKSDGHRHAGF